MCAAWRRWRPGCACSPVGVLVVVLSPATGRLVGSRGPRLPLVVAGAALAVGGGASLWIGPATPLPAVIASYLLFGIFLGTVNPPITNTAVSGMPASQAGVAAAIASTSRQVGATLGIAVLGSLAAGATAGAVGPSFAAATHVSWWVLVGLGVTALILGIVTTTQWANRTARRTAKRLCEDPLETRPDAGERRDEAELVTG